MIQIPKKENPFLIIEALKKLEPKKYAVAVNVRDMLSSLRNARRSVNQFRYYQPVFDLLLKDYRLNLKQRPLLTYREWFCFLLMALHDYRFEVIAWIMEIKPNTVRTHLQHIRQKLACRDLS